MGSFADRFNSSMRNQNSKLAIKYQRVKESEYQRKNFDSMTL